MKTHPFSPRGLAMVLATLFGLALVGQGTANEAATQKALRATGLLVAPVNKREANYGTCWVVDAQRKLAITNHHVVADRVNVKVLFPQYRQGELLTGCRDYNPKDQSIAGRVVAVDKKGDLALVQLAYLPAGIKALPLAERGPQPGQALYSVGNSGLAKKPLAEGTLWRTRQGTVKKVGFEVFSLDNGNRVEARTVFCDLGVRPGDSGGPAVDAQGRVAAVVSAFQDKGKESLCIDVSEVREFLAKFHGRKAPASSLVGRWTVSFRDKTAKERFFRLTFRPDGSCSWEGVKTFQGKYLLDDLGLNLDIPALQIREDLQLSWTDPSRFSFTSGDLEFVCTRR